MAASHRHVQDGLCCVFLPHDFPGLWALRSDYPAPPHVVTPFQGGSPATPLSTNRRVTLRPFLARPLGGSPDFQVVLAWLPESMC